MKPDCDCRALVLSAIRRGWVIVPKPCDPAKPRRGRAAFKALPEMQRALHAKRVAQLREKIQCDCEPQPGEIKMKAFLQSEGQRLDITPVAVFMRLKRGKYPNLTFRRPTKKTVYLKFNEHQDHTQTS